MDSYSAADDTKEIDYNLLHIHHHENFLNAPVNSIVTSPVPFSISQTRTTSSIKSANFNPITPFPDSQLLLHLQRRILIILLKKSSTINADLYIDLGYKKSQIMRFNNKILLGLQGDIKKLLVNKFNFFKIKI